jgi:regulator of sigma E protease
MGTLLTPGNIGSILLAILALGILIIVHEGGHFLIARLGGMRVDRFSIGFGPQLWSFKRGETVYQIAAIPLGGFVQIAGLNPGEEGMAADDPRAYPNRPVLWRLATIFAGPATNYIFAALMMVFIYLIWGVPGAGKTPIVDMIVEGKPAAAAGFKEGDEILRIGGTPVKETKDVIPLVNASGGKDLAFDITRDGKPLTLHVKPEKDGNDWRIGVQLGPREEWVAAPTGERIKRALIYPLEYSQYILQNLVSTGIGGIIKNGSGPVGIVTVMKKHIEHGARDAFMVVAIISTYLGLFNLLPLPGLDGGRLVFLAWEAISRRRVNQRMEQTVHMVGVLMLLTLILVITFKNDVPWVPIRRWLHL